MFQFSAFDELDAAVAGGEVLGGFAEPGGGDHHAAAGALVVHDSGEGADCIDGHNAAVAFGLDDVLGRP